MRTLLFSSLALALLAGCPQPADTPAPDAGQAPPGGGPPPGEGAGAAVPPPGDGTGAPPVGADGATPPVNEGAPLSPMKPVGFESLIKDGKSVTIKGKVVGLEKAQIDFTAVRVGADGEKSPDVIEIVQSTDGTFSVKAPATFDREIWVTAMSVSDTGPKAGDPGGMAGPLKLEGKDLTVDIPTSKDPSWSKKLPWFKEGSGSPNVLTPIPGSGPTGSPGGPPPGGVGEPGAAPADGSPPPAETVKPPPDGSKPG